MDPTAGGPATGKLVIRNIGLMLSGMLEQPILDADCLIAVDGRISAIGHGPLMDTDHATLTIDAMGCALSPGLIDSHVHPVVGDHTLRQNQLNWIDSTLNGGVTTMISAGEVHMPGRPREIVGLKAMAIATQRFYASFRPSGGQGDGGCAGDRTRDGGGRFRRPCGGGRDAAGRGGAGQRQGRADRAEDGGLGAGKRHAQHHPHRRPVHPRLWPDRRGHGARGRDGCGRPYQRRPYRPAR